MRWKKISCMTFGSMIVRKLAFLFQSVFLICCELLILCFNIKCICAWFPLIHTGTISFLSVQPLLICAVLSNNKNHILY